MFDEERARAAIAELGRKSLQEIQAETAETWAYRAYAAKMRGLYVDAVEYEHEALEHAALSGDDGLLAEVRSIIEEVR
jgi:hypothetical protein